LQDLNPQPSLPRLVCFPDPQKTDENLRDLALAWESVVESGMTAAGPETERLLQAAIEKSPDDPALLSALGFFAQKKGEADRARAFYEKALANDPTLIDAAANLGVIDAFRGQLKEALTLWTGAFQRAPGESRIGMNVARVYCEAGRAEKAREYVSRVLEFNPDLPEAKNLLRHLNSNPPSCKN